MPSTAPEIMRRLRSVSYVVAALLILLPLVELAASGWPFQLGQAPWRMGFVGSLTGALLTPILGLFLMLIVSAVEGDRPVLWLVSSVCLTGFVLSLLADGMFALDALQMKAQVRMAMSNRYLLASGWASVKLLAEAATLLLLALTSFRVAGGMRRQRIAAVDKGGGLMVRPPASPAPERNVTV